jgi:23S rRNA pseudouridine2605 synthase
MTDETSSLRLNKFLALQLGISRREADDLIDRGSVTVDGKAATLGARMRADSRVQLNGKDIMHDTSFSYVLFNKPIGYVCSRKAQDENPTIYEILPKEYHHLKPVGRLDKDSSGLLLLSNDGDFTFRMTHPKFEKTKVYEAEIDHDLAPLHHQMISDIGVDLTDGNSQFVLERLEEGNSKKWRITMREGRNRQIRRTFGALGYTVLHLHRTQFGNYTIDELTPGHHKISKASS